jgi:hypothetical protein
MLTNPRVCILSMWAQAFFVISQRDRCIAEAIIYFRTAVSVGYFPATPLREYYFLALIHKKNIGSRT